MLPLRMVVSLVLLSLFGNLLEIRSMSFFHQFSKVFNNEALEQVENLNHELERNYTILKQGLKKTGAPCGQHFKNSPTLTFLCLYASTLTTSGSGGNVPEVYSEGEGEHKPRKKGKPDEKKVEGTTVPPQSNSNLTIGDVLCMKKKIEPEDEHIHQPIRTISCCQSSGQKCTYDQSESTRSKYVARCHTKSKESTEYVMKCCEKFGEVVVEPPNDDREATDNKCY